jgi:glutathione S-transferase
MSNELVLFHAPNTRSTSALLMLEEIGIEYDLHVLDMSREEQLDPRYLAINPMGKVPALVHNGAVVTEQAAILLYLADQFPQAGLAPAIGDADRGPYLRWMVFYPACFEPALVDRAMKHEPGPRRMVPYGDYDTMFGTLLAQLSKGPWMLGERFTAADVLWGMALTWTRQFGMIPDEPKIVAYLERFAKRPALARMRARDEELAAALKKQAGAGD